MKGSLCRLAETSFLWRDTAMRIRERFNPRAPCGARPPMTMTSAREVEISTHAPLAGRDAAKQRRDDDDDISTHAPLAGRDVLRLLRLRAKVISTHAPLAGRDFLRLLKPGEFCISTHAPLAGRDLSCNFCSSDQEHFNPRAPCGARLYTYSQATNNDVFQPTRPLRGATSVREDKVSIGRISTHAPLAGRDCTL